MLSPKILTPLYATHNRFGLSVRPPYAVGVTDTCAFAVDGASGIPIAYLAGILNSCAAQFYHKRRAKLKRAHYYEYVVGVLEHFPVPPLSRDPTAVAAIEGIVDKMSRTGTQGSLYRTGNEELNRIVNRLYGFSSSEERLITRLGRTVSVAALDDDALNADMV